MEPSRNADADVEAAKPPNPLESTTGDPHLPLMRLFNEKLGNDEYFSKSEQEKSRKYALKTLLFSGTDIKVVSDFYQNVYQTGIHFETEDLFDAIVFGVSSESIDFVMEKLKLDNFSVDFDEMESDYSFENILNASAGINRIVALPQIKDVDFSFSPLTCTPPFLGGVECALRNNNVSSLFLNFPICFVQKEVKNPGAMNFVASLSSMAEQGMCQIQQLTFNIVDGETSIQDHDFLELFLEKVVSKLVKLEGLFFYAQFSSRFIILLSNLLNSGNLKCLHLECCQPEEPFIADYFPLLDSLKTNIVLTTLTFSCLKTDHQNIVEQRMLEIVKHHNTTLLHFHPNFYPTANNELHFYLVLNHFGRKMARDTTIPLDSFVNSLLSVQDDRKYKYRPFDSQKLGLLYGLLRELPSKWISTVMDTSSQSPDENVVAGTPKLQKTSTKKS